MKTQSQETAQLRSGQLLSWQLRSVPVVNAAAEIKEGPRGTRRVTTPLAHKGWSRLLKRAVRMRDSVTLELDRLSAETLSLVDGKRSVEEIVDHFQVRWKLSFFEARGMVLEFLKALVKKQVIILNAPARLVPETEEE